MTQACSLDAIAWGSREDANPALSAARPGDMVSTMKTTIDIAEPILTRAREVAVADGVTLRALIEEGLRRVLAERERRGPFRLRRAAFRGQGLQPGVVASRKRLREFAYEGRGG